MNGESRNPCSFFVHFQRIFSYLSLWISLLQLFSRLNVWLVKYCTSRYKILLIRKCERARIVKKEWSRNWDDINAVIKKLWNYTVSKTLINTQQNLINLINQTLRQDSIFYLIKWSSARLVNYKFRKLFEWLKIMFNQIFTKNRLVSNWTKNIAADLVELIIEITKHVYVLLQISLSLIARKKGIGIVICIYILYL